jgi:uncharacterized membrane protein (UPF0127 family)
MMNRLRSSLALALFLLVGCQRASSPQSALPTVQMKLGSRTYTLEVAADDEARTRGLMRRDSMPADHGMIFVFMRPQKLGFWMRNTRIPLDIVYIDEHGKVDSVKQMQPYVETPVSSEGEVKYAIELNQGQAASAGVKAGDVVEVPARARETNR